MTGVTVPPAFRFWRTAKMLSARRNEVYVRNDISFARALHSSALLAWSSMSNPLLWTPGLHGHVSDWRMLVLCLARVFNIDERDLRSSVGASLTENLPRALKAACALQEALHALVICFCFLSVFLTCYSIITPRIDCLVTDSQDARLQVLRPAWHKTELGDWNHCWHGFSAVSSA